MSRGDLSENIYRDDVDRKDFLRMLAEACQKADWQVHAYCWGVPRARMQAAQVDASERESGRSRRGNPKAK